MSCWESPIAPRLACVRAVEPLRERAAAGERRPQVRIGHEHLEAASLEVELVDHHAVEQADDVRHGLTT
jgi:hypothetical protein